MSNKIGETMMEEEFETMNLKQQDDATITQECVYVKVLLEASKLHIFLQPGNVKTPKRDCEEYGLFHLFIKGKFWENH